MNYRPDIDGLRALAVLAVVFYHAGLGFPGGYIGVDVFFVISGYLITGILLRSLENGTFSYRDFWMRRVYRLVPALLLMTVVTLAIGSVVLLPRDLMDLGGAAIAQPLLMSNVYFWRVVKNGYFGDPPEIRPLLHTWSLGVEEQFYVVFPLLLAAVWKFRRSRKSLGFALLLTTLASLFLCVLLTPTKSIAAFFNLPARAWELGLGGLLHYLPPVHRLSRASREVVSIAGLLTILAGCWLFSHDTLFPGWRALVPCLGAMALLYANSLPTATGWLLSRPLPVALGRQSYSLYLWHWPIIAFGLYLVQISGNGSRWVAVALSFLLGFISWRWVESIWRNGANLPLRQSGPRAALLYGVYLVPCFLFGVTVIQGMGFPQSWPLNIPEPTNAQDRRYLFEATAPPVPVGPKYLGDLTQERVSFLLWGDSHAMAVAAAFDVLAKKYHLKGIQLTASATPPLVRAFESDPWSTVKFAGRAETGLLPGLQRHKPRWVFLAARWSAYANPNIANDLLHTQQVLKRLECQPILVLDVPGYPGSPIRYAHFRGRWPQWFPESLVSSERHQGEVGDLNSTLVKAWEGDVLDFAVPFLNQLPYSNSDRHFLYYDEDHLTDTGALLLVPILEDSFARMASETVR